MEEVWSKVRAFWQKPRNRKKYRYLAQDVLVGAIFLRFCIMYVDGVLGFSEITSSEQVVLTKSMELINKMKAEQVLQVEFVGTQKLSWNSLNLQYPANPSSEKSMEEYFRENKWVGKKTNLGSHYRKKGEAIQVEVRQEGDIINVCFKGETGRDERTALMKICRELGEFN